MIEIYAGLPGSGKTYSMVARALEKMRQKGKLVYANFHVEGAEYYEPHEFLDLEPGQRGAIVMTDELQNWMSSRHFHKLPAEWLHRTSQTRKKGMQWWVSSQHPGSIDKAVRDRAAFIHWCHAWPGGYDSEANAFLFLDRVYQPQHGMKDDPNDPAIRVAQHVRWRSRKVTRAYDTMEEIDLAEHLITREKAA